MFSTDTEAVIWSFSIVNSASHVVPSYLFVAGTVTSKEYVPASVGTSNEYSASGSVLSLYSKEMFSVLS